MKTPLLHNPIRLFAVICVAATSVFVMAMSNKLTNILSSPEWCGKALQAEKISSQNFGGLTACVDLLKIQLNSVAHVSLIYAGVIALCLLTLIVIVIAGARLDLKANKDGIQANMDRSDAPQPVVVTNEPSDPVPTTAAPPTGPAMPEPKP
jgi:hypothetical protein